MAQTLLPHGAADLRAWGRLAGLWVTCGPVGALRAYGRCCLGALLLGGVVAWGQLGDGAALGGGHTALVTCNTADGSLDHITKSHSMLRYHCLLALLFHLPALITAQTPCHSCKPPQWP